MEGTLIESITRSIHIGALHSDHIKEDRLLQEDFRIRQEKRKYIQQTHSHGNLLLIILSPRLAITEG